MWNSDKPVIPLCRVEHNGSQRLRIHETDRNMPQIQEYLNLIKMQWLIGGPQVLWESSWSLSTIKVQTRPDRSTGALGGLVTKGDHSDRHRGPEKENPCGWRGNLTAQTKGIWVSEGSDSKYSGRVCATVLQASFPYQNAVQPWKVGSCSRHGRSCPLRSTASRTGRLPSPGTRHSVGKMFFNHRLVVVVAFSCWLEKGQHFSFMDRFSPQKLWSDSSSSSRQLKLTRP